MEKDDGGSTDTALEELSFGAELAFGYNFTSLYVCLIIATQEKSVVEFHLGVLLEHQE